MRKGLYEDCTNEDYHSDSAISRSGIMLFDQSPYHYWANYLNPDRPVKESTKAMEFGSAFHAYILEPQLFLDSYATVPIYEKLPEKKLLKYDGREKFEAYKKEKAEIELKNQYTEEEHLNKSTGRIIISRDDLHTLELMKQALENHSQAWELIRGGIYENSFFWTDSESGLDVKCRPDIMHNSMIVDLKTCVSASSRAYQMAMVDGGLHVQGAMMIDGIEAVTSSYRPNVINICIEKTYPFAIGIKVISEDAIKAGREKYKAVLMRMKKAFEKQDFPAYEVEHVDLPGWAT